MRSVPSRWSQTHSERIARDLISYRRGLDDLEAEDVSVESERGRHVEDLEERKDVSKL